MIGGSDSCQQKHQRKQSFKPWEWNSASWNERRAQKKGRSSVFSMTITPILSQITDVCVSVPASKVRSHSISFNNPKTLFWAVFFQESHLSSRGVEPLQSCQCLWSVSTLVFVCSENSAFKETTRGTLFLFMFLIFFFLFSSSQFTLQRRTVRHVWGRVSSAPSPWRSSSVSCWSQPIRCWGMAWSSSPYWWCGASQSACACRSLGEAESLLTKQRNNAQHQL